MWLIGHCNAIVVYVAWTVQHLNNLTYLYININLFIYLYALDRRRTILYTTNTKF